MTSSPEETPLFAVVMAGGSGTRFWPLSRRQRPKQLLPLAEGRSLLAATVSRLAPLVAPARTWVATTTAVADAVRRELPQLSPENVLTEPVGRDTAACVGWVAWRLARLHPGAVTLVLPSDHLVGDAPAWRLALAAAAATACARGELVTIGVRASRPESGFGYLELGEDLAVIQGLSVRRVRSFVEKPSRERAAEFIALGNFRWNSGIFAWTVSAIERAIRSHLPELAAGLDAMMADVEKRGEPEALQLHYPSLPSVSVDFGVMEKATNVAAVCADFSWSDVGSWSALTELPPAGPGAGVTRGEVVTVDSEGCVLVSEGPLVATIGIRDLVVVATPDAVLVVPKAQTQRVKELVEELRRRKREDLL
jgi:mannose-1-phosphate guanylyltransferase